jgi:hypothetical protein
VLLCAAVLPATAAPAPKKISSDLTAVVNLSATPGPTIPTDFLGLSFEATSLTTTAIDPVPGGNLVGMLRSMGPGVLRFGGDSLDRDLAWQSQRTQPTLLQPAKDPDWAKFVLTTGDLDRLKRLLDATGWRVILGLNLGHYDPAAAADEAKEAVARLGSSLVSLEIGNEPNAYVLNKVRPDTWGPEDYKLEVTAYRDAIRKVAPTVQLSGPASYPPFFLDAWTQAMGAEGTELTQHLYPLNACSPQTPTVELLLSRTTAKREAALIRSGLASAAAAGLKLRLGETNSVICSGFYGVSDVFASALWATDYLLLAAQTGAAAVNLHSGFGVCPDETGSKGKAPYYTVLCAATQADKDAGRFRASPSWYGVQLMGKLRGHRFLPVSLSGRQSGSSSAYATVGDDGLVRVVVIDAATRSADAGHTLTVRLDPSWGRGEVISLTGPSPYLPTGTRLQGAAVAEDGSLTPGAPTLIKGKDGAFTLSVRPGSATMLTLSPACSVPNLKGLVITSATATLDRNGCAVGKVSKIRAKKGVKARYVVLRQHLRPGSVYASRSAVGFTLAPQKFPKKKVVTTLR